MEGCPKRNGGSRRGKGNQISLGQRGELEKKKKRGESPELSVGDRASEKKKGDYQTKKNDHFKKRV